MTTHGAVLIFPRAHRGDPDPHRYALAAIGFQWHGDVWRRGRVMLGDEMIDGMDERTWQQRLRRWTRQRPQRRR